MHTAITVTVAGQPSRLRDRRVFLTIADRLSIAVMRLFSMVDSSLVFFCVVSIYYSADNRINIGINNCFVAPLILIKTVILSIIET